MFGIAHYPSFLLAILIFQGIPGPATLLILRTTASYGPRSGFATVFGTLSADFVYMLSAILGIGTLLVLVPSLLFGLQIFGCLYIAWMGIGLLKRAARPSEKQITPTPAHRHLYRQALFVGLTNPKVVLFFMAFFPSFLALESSRLTLVMMILHVSILSFLYQANLVGIGNILAKRFRKKQSVTLWTRRLAGMLLLLFALRMAWTHA